MNLADDIDISRGDMLAKPNNQPQVRQDLEAMICWFADRPLKLNGHYLLGHTIREAKCVVRDVRYKIDINTLHKRETDRDVAMNDVARIRLRAAVPILCDPYRRNRNTGSFILIDEFSDATVAAGMIL